jgi:hypothetical protein
MPKVGQQVLKDCHLLDRRDHDRICAKQGGRRAWLPNGLSVLTDGRTHSGPRTSWLAHHGSLFPPAPIARFSPRSTGHRATPRCRGPSVRPPTPSSPRRAGSPAARRTVALDLAGRPDRADQGSGADVGIVEAALHCVADNRRPRCTRLSPGSSFRHRWGVP